MFMYKKLEPGTKNQTSFNCYIAENDPSKQTSFKHCMNDENKHIYEQWYYVLLRMSAQSIASYQRKGKTSLAFYCFFLFTLSFSLYSFAHVSLLICFYACVNAFEISFWWRLGCTADCSFGVVYVLFAQIQLNEIC